jgi:putative (di)nucleoside polyphosphate hydrolase
MFIRPYRRFQRRPDLPYRPNIGIALFNPDGQVFMGERINIEDAWQMPQGGIDKGESLLDAAYRELLEEVGTNKAEYLGETPDWLYYDFPDYSKNPEFRGRYRGQKQKWVAMRFTGEDGDINLNHYEKPEFSQWRWVPLSEVTDMIVAFKRPIYEEVVKEFTKFSKV